MVARFAAAEGVPEDLVRRVIKRESRGNPRVVSQGNYGLMQIKLRDRAGDGYSGNAAGLLDAETNMTYAVKYLAGAWRVAHGTSTSPCIIMRPAITMPQSTRVAPKRRATHGQCLWRQPTCRAATTPL